MNQVTLTGRLIKDVELRYTSSEKAFSMFTIAVRRETGKDETDFITCMAWDKNAEALNRYCAKGSLILVDGRIQVEFYEKDGHRRTDIKVVAHRIEFLDKRQNIPQPEPIREFKPTNEPAPFFDEGDQEDLPF